MTSEELMRMVRERLYIADMLAAVEKLIAGSLGMTTLLVWTAPRRINLPLCARQPKKVTAATNQCCASLDDLIERTLA